MSSIELYKQSLCAAIDGQNKALLDKVAVEIVSLKDSEIKKLIGELEQKFSAKQISWLHTNLNDGELVELSSEELKTKFIAENNIKDNLRSFIVKGESFKLIRDQKLYRNKYFSFEAYCKAAFGLEPGTCKRYISTCEVINKLKESVGEKYLPENFYIALELTKVKVIPVDDFWHTVMTTSEQLGVEITQKFVSKLHDQLKVDLNETQIIPAGQIVEVTKCKHLAKGVFSTWGRVYGFEQGRYQIYVGKEKLLSVFPPAVESIEEEEIHGLVIRLSMSEDSFVSFVAQCFFKFREYNDAQIHYIKQLSNVADAN
jgi:hypothetical protein